MTEGTLSHVNWTLASSLASVEPVEEAAHHFALRAGFDEDTSSHIAMVTREAVVNAVLHGNKSDPAKHVKAGIELTAEALTIVVADEGAGFDPARVPDPLAPENLLRGSGRGVFLMRALMDEVRIRPLHPGTEITLIKRRSMRP